MEQKQIIEGNKIIAEFMGKTRRYETTIEIFYDNLKYHSSWDWLMPVVEKIEGIDADKNMIDGTGRNFHFDIGKRFTRVIYDWNSYSISHEQLNMETFGKFKESFQEYRHSFFDNNKLHSTWRAVVDFINWHNATNK